MSHKIMSLREAVELINDGDVLASTSAGLVGYPAYLVEGLEKRFLETNSPKGLTKLAAGGHGAGPDPRGDKRFGHPGFLKRYISTHPVTADAVLDLIMKNEVEGYVLPQGIMNQLYRASAAKQPGILSKIGIGTYVDPRQDGGKLNSIAKEDLVQLMEIDGEEWLFYKALPVNAAFIRATTADEDGNLTIEREALKLEILEVALAAKARNGKVIAQVERVAERGTLRPKDVVVPGELVDAVVIVEDPAKLHTQTNRTIYSPYLSGELKRPAMAAEKPKEVLAPEDVACRRAVFELYPGAIVNIGFGIGAGVSALAEIEGMVDKITFTLELGTFGGTPTPAYDFGAAFNPVSFVSPPTMFDFYHGGGLDIAFLGVAEVDKDGNVNVSQLGDRKMGQGGFIDISQASKKVVFVSTFRAKGFKASVGDGKLKIEQEGAAPKFVEKVKQITYNGRLAAERGQEVVYVTERAVFKLTKDGIMLTEIAPGMDLEKDILGQMEFKPIISDDLKQMDERIFIPGRMGCFD